jgi:DNA-binding Lrp family transcriptional regulator
MVNAIVLLEIEKNLINTVAERLVDIKGVSEVYSVAGDYDLVAVVRTKNNDNLADVVTNQMLKADGILDSKTLIAFRVFSKYELEKIFSVGME